MKSLKTVSLAEKFSRTIAGMGADLKALKVEIARLKIRPVLRDGKDGEDGQDAEAPDIEGIVCQVLELIPPPVHGEDGQDAPIPAIVDIVAQMLPQMPKPKDGDTPDAALIAQDVLSQIPAPEVIHGTNGEAGGQGEPGAAGAAGKDGAPGKDGASITDVKLDKQNRLFVWIDGVKKLVGTLVIPKSMGPFTPSQVGGGGPKKGGKAASFRFIDGSDTQLGTDTAIFSNGVHTFTLLDHLTSKDPIEIRCISGVLSLIGTTDTPTLTEAESVKLYPTPTGWLYNS